MLMTRTITAATVLISWPGHLGLFSLYWVAFLSDYVFTIRQLPQLWRLVTAFCITGPQLGLIMDPFFFWQYSSKLENGNPRFSPPGAYAVYLFFNAVIILVSASLLFNTRRVSLHFTSLDISARPVHFSCHGSWN
jgi:Derlin-2/3